MSATAAPAQPGVYVPPAKGTRESLMLNIGFFAMVIGMFMAILDIQIVASSIQKIQAGVSASAEEVAWIQTSYLIAEVIGIPLSGLLNRALSMRRLFVSLSAAYLTNSGPGYELIPLIAFLVPLEGREVCAVVGCDEQKPSTHAVRRGSKVRRSIVRLIVQSPCRACELTTSGPRADGNGRSTETSLARLRSD